jgi:phosphopantetheine adenylyltransferase
MRRIVWPILLNANVLKENINIQVDHSWQKIGKFTHRESAQIAKDINRSLNSFELCKKWSKTIKVERRIQLSKMIHGVLNKNDTLYYY